MIYNWRTSLLIAWELAEQEMHLPTPNPRSDEDEPVFIGSREGEKTVVVGEETSEYIYSDNMRPIDLDAVK